MINILFCSIGLNNERRSVNESLAYMTNIDQLDVGFEFPPYEDPPPPYSPPKPLHDFPNDDPPPYELTSPNPLEAEGQDSSTLVRDTDNGQCLPFSVMGISRSRNVTWTRKHLLRPCSAEESCGPELIELTRLNRRSKSSVLSRCRRSCTISDHNSENLESRNCRSDRSSDHLLVKQMHFDSLASQLLHHRTACLSPLKSPVELDHSETDEQHKQSENNQNSFCSADMLWSTPLKLTTECPKRYEMLFDPIGSQPNSLSACPDEGSSPNRARVECLANCNTAIANSSVIQSTPEVFSSGLKQSHLSFSNPCRQEALQSFGKTRNTPSKPRPSLFSGSLLKKKKQHRPLPCMKPMSDTAVNISMLRSLQALSPTYEHCEADVYSRNTEHETITAASDHQFTNPLLCSCRSCSRHVQLHRTQGDTKVNEDLQNVADSVSMETKQSVEKNTAKLDGSNDASSFQLLSPVSGSVLALESPVYQQFLRSESVTSKASFFSICSETGEHKHTPNTISSYHHSKTSQNSLPNSTVSWQLNSSGIGNVRQPVATKTELVCLPDETSVLGLTNAVATETLKHTSNADWIAKQEHFIGNNRSTLPGNKKQRKGSVDCPNSLHDLYSAVQSKKSKEQSCQMLDEACQFGRQSLGHEQNRADNLGKNSSNQFNCSADLSNLSVHDCHTGAKSLFDNACCPTVNELLPETKKGFSSTSDRHSSNTCKEQQHPDSGHKRKSKQLESFEHLVSRILQQLEITYFDDFGMHLARLQKNGRPKSFEHQSDHSSDRFSVSGKRTHEQKSRPISLPSVKNKFLSDDVVRSKLAALDVANKNHYMTDTYCKMAYDNEHSQIQCSEGELTYNCFDELHAEL